MQRQKSNAIVTRDSGFLSWFCRLNVEKQDRRYPIPGIPNVAAIDLNDPIQVAAIDLNRQGGLGEPPYLLALFRLYVDHVGIGTGKRNL
jgi:hypothetical protein